MVTSMFAFQPRRRRMRTPETAACWGSSLLLESHWPKLNHTTMLITVWEMWLLNGWPCTYLKFGVSYYLLILFVGV